MRTIFILAFGLLISFAAAPVAATPFTVTSAQKALTVDGEGRLKRDLNKIVRRNQAAIDFICKAKPKCWAQSNIAQQGMLSVYMRRISAARACARLSVGKAVMCLIETGDKAFFPAIEAAIERQERAREALNFLKKKGCTLEGERFACASLLPAAFLAWLYSLLGLLGSGQHPRVFARKAVVAAALLAALAVWELCSWEGLLCGLIGWLLKSLQAHFSLKLPEAEGETVEFVGQEFPYKRGRNPLRGEQKRSYPQARLEDWAQGEEGR